MNTIRVQRQDMPDWAEARHQCQVRQRTRKVIAQWMSYKELRAHVQEKQSIAFLHPGMYKTIWDKRVHLLLSAISAACRGLRWQQDILRKILSFAHPFPYGIDVDWGILEMLGPRRIKLENSTNKAHWDGLKHCPCNKRKCFPVKEYMTKCGDCSISVESSNDNLSKAERRELSQALALVKACERRSEAVSAALDKAIGLSDEDTADPSF